MADVLLGPDLVSAARRGDEEAARELVRGLYPLVAKLVRAYRPPRTAEEDLCQMIFIKVLQKLPQFSARVPLEHWVSRIAVNTCLNQIRWEKARPEVREADLSDEQAAVVRDLAMDARALSPDRSLAARELTEKLLASLRPAERLVVDLLHLQERSVAEIQQITGWSAAAVKVTRLSRATENEATVVHDGGGDGHEGK